MAIMEWHNSINWILTPEKCLNCKFSTNSFRVVLKNVTVICEMIWLKCVLCVCGLTTVSVMTMFSRCKRFVCYDNVVLNGMHGTGCCVMCVCAENEHLHWCSIDRNDAIQKIASSPSLLLLKKREGNRNKNSRQAATRAHKQRARKHTQTHRRT